MTVPHVRRLYERIQPATGVVLVVVTAVRRSARHAA